MSETLKGKTAKGLFWGGLSSGIQQVLNLVFGIFLARILNADDYGMVGMLAIFTLIANTLQESGLTAAIANKPEATHKDYNAVFWFSILTGLTLYIVLFLCAPLIARFYDTPELVPLARYSFLGFLISSFGVGQNAYMFRNMMVKQKSITLMVSLLISGTVGIIMAYNGMSYWGIATQNIVYVFSMVVLYWIFSPWRPSFRIDLSPLKGMVGFSSKLLLTNVFQHLNNNIFTVLLGRFYTEREVGNYTQANKWNYMGYALVSDALHNVSQPILSPLKNDLERQRNVFRKLLRFTSFATFPVMFGISFIAPELIVVAITDKWLPAVEILQLLAISGAFVPIIRLYSNLLISRGQSNIYMWNTIAICLLLLLAVCLAYPYGMTTMFIVYVVINILWLFVWHFFLQKEIGLSLWNAMKDIVPFAVIATASMVATYFITLPVTNIYWLLAAKVVITGIIYIFTLWISRAKILRESIQFITKRTI